MVSSTTGAGGSKADGDFVDGDASDDVSSFGGNSVIPSTIDDEKGDDLKEGKLVGDDDCIDGASAELNEAEADAAAAGFDALDSELTVISDFNLTEDNAA